MEQAGLHVVDEQRRDLQSVRRPLAALDRHGRELHADGGQRVRPEWRLSASGSDSHDRRTRDCSSRLPGMDRATRCSSDAKATIPKWTRERGSRCASISCWGSARRTAPARGFYIWPSIEAAKQAHNDEWREGVKKRTGGYPTIRYFDMMAAGRQRAGEASRNGRPSGKARRSSERGVNVSLAAGRAARRLPMRPGARMVLLAADRIARLAPEIARSAARSAHRRRSARARSAAILTSLARSPSAKPVAKVAAEHVLLDHDSRSTKLRPVETLITSIITAGSSPNWRPIASASLAAANEVPARKLLSAFMAWPQPSPPTSNSLLAHARQHRLDRGTAAASPPIMMASVPSLARGTPPETGASTSAILRSASSRAERARADRIGRAHVDDDRCRDADWRRARRLAPRAARRAPRGRSAAW